MAAPAAAEGRRKSGNRPGILRDRRSCGGETTATMISAGTVAAAISVVLLTATAASGSSSRVMRRRAWRQYNQTCFGEKEAELR